MSAEIETLIAVLEESEKMYEQLLPLMEREKSAAFASEAEKFTAVIEEKEEVLSQLQRLERKRQMLLGQLSAAWNIPVGMLRLSVLADKVEGTQRLKVQHLQSSLKDLVRQVKKSNEENRMMIQHCLEIAQNTLGFFQHWIMPKDVYGSSGQMNMHQKNGSFISGAV